MKKNHLTLLHFNKQPNKKHINEKLVNEKEILHIQSENLLLKKLKSNQNHATFSFFYETKEKTWEIPFELEVVIDTLIVDFHGENLPDFVRIKASEIIDGLVESLRFKHKDKYWSLSHYYIDDIEEYKERLQKSFPTTYHDEWKRIFNLSKLEAMDDDNYLFFEMEDIHDLLLLIVGDDGLILCEYLSEMGLIHYQKIAENQYEIEFNECLDDLQNIQRKIIFAREIALYGYNMWVDYGE